MKKIKTIKENNSKTKRKGILKLCFEIFVVVVSYCTSMRHLCTFSQHKHTHSCPSASVFVRIYTLSLPRQPIVPLPLFYNERSWCKVPTQSVYALQCMLNRSAALTLHYCDTARGSE